MSSVAGEEMYKNILLLTMMLADCLHLTVFPLKLVFVG